MATTQTLTKSQSAQMGTPTTFVLAVTNGGASQILIKSIQPTVKRPDGQRADCCSIGAVVASPTLGQAVVGANQFNVPVAAAGTVYFSFQVVFFGPAIAGGPAQPSMAFVVDCITTTDDPATFGCNSPLQVNLNQPQFGQAPGSPPNPVASIGQLDFQSPYQGALAL